MAWSQKTQHFDFQKYPLEIIGEKLFDPGKVNQKKILKLKKLSKKQTAILCFH